MLTGSENTATGRYTFSDNKTGNKNTAIGFQSLYKNGVGYSNTAVGYESLYMNYSGVNNAAYGTRSLYNNSSSNYNTAIGWKKISKMENTAPAAQKETTIPTSTADIQVFPNPTAGLFTLHSGYDLKGADIQFLDLSGKAQRIRIQQISQQDRRIEMSNANPAVLIY